MDISRLGNHDGEPSVGLLAIVALLVVCRCSGGAERLESDVPTSLRIVARIEGKDELHISHGWAGWVNLAYGASKEVEINGREWNPQALPEWQAGRSSPLLRGDIDLAGALLEKVRGRGQVDLGYDARGLVVTFDDGPQGGADDYEVLIEFADIVCEQSARTFQAGMGVPESVEISIGGQIDGGNAVRISPDKAQWLHYEIWCPELVTINGQAWNPKTEPVLAAPNSPFYPRGTDVANARLIERKGRGAVQIDRAGDELTIRFDDRVPSGGDEYLARVRIPLEALVRVEVQCDEPAYTAGEQLRILRFREGDADPEIVFGRRIIDRQGRRIAALPPGEYEFEVQRAAANVLVSLRSGRVQVDSKSAKVRLGATQIRTTDLKIAGHPTLKLTDVGIRSILPTGDVSWRRSSPTQRLGLILSPNQTYRVRAMGSNGVTHAAVWKELAARELSRITDQTDQWIELSFDWHPGTLPRTKSGVVFHFPDTKAELPLADRTRLLTNRRFVELGYWYELDNGRKVSFHRRGYVLPAATADHRLTLGGPITGRAAAAVMQNQNLGNVNMRQIWCDISAQDTAGHTLDTAESNVDWNWFLRMRDGSPVPEFPLSEENIARIGNPADTVLAIATLHLDQPVRFELFPESLVPMESKHIRTDLPSYMTWRTKAYLAQAERSLNGIAAVRDLPVDPNYKVQIAWWMNYGAVGGYGGISMDIRGPIADFGWLSHPWGISHELLHGFGYGHTDDMVRVDRLMLEYFPRFQWSVVDRPEFVPPELVSRDGPDG